MKQHVPITQHIIAWLLVVTVAVAAFTLPRRRPSRPNVVVSARLVAADNQFGLDLLTRIQKESPANNTALSPVGLATALQVAQDAAGGDTANAFSRTLHLDAMTVAERDSAGRDLTRVLQSPDPNCQLALANALWVGKPRVLPIAFEDSARENHGAAVSVQDFASPGVANLINAWVSARTDDHLSGVIYRADITPSTRALLTDAVSFQGPWQTRFEPSATNPEPFTLASGATVTAMMMHGAGPVPYLSTGNAEIVSLPLGDGALRYIMIMPAKDGGMRSLLSTITPTTWSAWMSQLKPSARGIAFPRLHIEY